MPFNIEKDWITAAGLRAVAIVCLHHDDHKPQHRCGYVAVPADHPAYQKNYSDQLDCIKQEDVDSTTLGDKSPMLILTAACRSDNEFESVRRSLDVLIECHGGLTFSGNGYFLKEDSELWWFGFDCAHYGDADITESLLAAEYGFSDRGGKVRTLEFVELHCEKIATQLAALQN